MMKTVYIAGPDLFARDTWPAYVARIRALCATLKLEPVFPVPPEPLTGPGITTDAQPTDAIPIYRACMDQVRGADALLANLSPFRGSDPDSGTVWEAATAKALGKIVVGFTTIILPYCIKMPYSIAPDGAWLDSRGSIIERFGLPINLMPAIGVDRLITTADFADPLTEGLRCVKALLDERDACSREISHVR